MTIDKFIKALEEARDIHGGEADVATTFETKNLAAVCQINSIGFSKFTGIHIEIDPPWWCYGADKKTAANISENGL
jgi:hypothetical protein